MHGQEILINQILIHEKLGISKEGVIDVTHATFDEIKIAWKKIVSPHFLWKMNNGM